MTTYSSSDFLKVMLSCEKLMIDLDSEKIQIVKKILLKIMRLLNKKLFFITDFKYVQISAIDENIKQINEILLEHSSIIKKKFDVEINEKTKMNNHKDFIKIFKKLLSDINHKIIIVQEKFIFIKS